MTRLPDTPGVVAAREFCRAILLAFPGTIVTVREVRRVR